MLREALRLDTQDFILFNLAMILQRQYTHSQEPALQGEAIELLQRYLELAPSDGVAQQYLQDLAQKKLP